MQRSTYHVILTPDEKDGDFVVTCSDVPELVTQGETTEDAISEAVLDPKHGTKVPALERALDALGKRVEMVVI